MITFTVRGLPAPQGSKRAFRNKHSGRIQQVESSKRVAPWRSDVRDAAMMAMEVERRRYGDSPDEMPPLTVPVAVELAFRFPRPKGHFGTGRNAAVLKPTAAAHPAGKPDLDKLARAILDAITSLVIADDALVVSLVASKAYADHQPPGVTVTVRAATPPASPIENVTDQLKAAGRTIRAMREAMGAHFPTPTEGD